MGAIGTRLSLRPLSKGGTRSKHSPGVSRRGIEKSCLWMIPRPSSPATGAAYRVALFENRIVENGLRSDAQRSHIGRHDANHQRLKSLAPPLTKEEIRWHACAVLPKWAWALML